MRIGIGYDVHKLVSNRALIIGGVEIPHDFGLLGHSDADVLTHAIMDSILGALGKGDIGKHFPDSDEKYKGISSLELLKAVGNILQNEGCEVGNIDAVIIAQSPKMAPHIKQMRVNISNCLCCEIDRINIKATTTEELGFEGRKEGIASQAVVILSQQTNIGGEYGRKV